MPRRNNTKKKQPKQSRGNNYQKQFPSQQKKNKYNAKPKKKNFSKSRETAAQVLRPEKQVLIGKRYAKNGLPFLGLKSLDVFSYTRQVLALSSEASPLDEIAIPFYKALSEGTDYKAGDIMLTNVSSNPISVGDPVPKKGKNLSSTVYTHLLSQLYIPCPLHIFYCLFKDLFAVQDFEVSDKVAKFCDALEKGENPEVPWGDITKYEPLIFSNVAQFKKMALHLLDDPTTNFSVSQLDIMVSFQNKVTLQDTFLGQLSIMRDLLLLEPGRCLDYPCVPRYYRLPYYWRGYYQLVSMLDPLELIAYYMAARRGFQPLFANLKAGPKYFMSFVEPAVMFASMSGTKTVTDVVVLRPSLQESYKLFSIYF